MKGPVADRIRRKVKGDLAARLHDHRVLARRPVALAGNELEEMSVEMDGMPIIVSLIRLMRTRSSLRNGIGSTWSDIFMPSKDHIKRSILPVR